MAENEPKNHSDLPFILFVALILTIIVANARLKPSSVPANVNWKDLRSLCRLEVTVPQHPRLLITSGESIIATVDEVVTLSNGKVLDPSTPEETILAPQSTTATFSFNNNGDLEINTQSKSCPNPQP